MYERKEEEIKKIFMFTGIIQATTKIVSVEKKDTCLRVRVTRPAKWSIALGQSITVDGICSTVVAFGKTYFDVEYMPETLRKTTAGQFMKDRTVNLERSLTLRDPLDGSIVSGHVDACGTVTVIEHEGESWLITLSYPLTLSKYIAAQGSIVVNGVSLTVAQMKKKGTFTVALIPYTLTHTNLGGLRKKDRVNIEIDVLARYVVHALESKNKKK